MLFCNIDLLRADGTVSKDQFIGTRGQNIEYIGTQPPEENFGERYDGRKKLLLPGLINSHSHVPMTLLRGYGEGLTLDRWLNERIFPFEAKLTSESVYYASLLGIAEMFRSGVTSFSEMYFFCEDIARAILDAGISCNISRAITAFDSTTLAGKKYFIEMEELFQNYHGMQDGRLLVDACIHAEYTNNMSVTAELAEFALENGCRMQIHLSETLKEHDECIERHGKTPTEFFCDAGLLDVPTTAAHCVYLTDKDMEILKEKDTTVAHCPSSNMKLGSGIAPVTRMLKKGMRVALGTDGAASNNNLDMLREMRLAALIQNGSTGDPTDLQPKDVLLMATKAGAEGQGRADTGEIAEGKRADLVVLDTDSISMTPCHDPLVNLVYSAQSSDILLTMCRGNIVYKDGVFPTLDIEKIKERVSWFAEKFSK